MTGDEKRKLELFALNLREQIIISTYYAKSGHPGGSLSIVEYITYLYNCVMRHDPSDPVNPNRDRFVLSKGHAAPALYGALALLGYFPIDEMKTLRKQNSILQGHPNMNTTPGVDMSTGSLGQGISAAVGMAKGAKILKSDVNVHCLLGDGEIEEGQVWEAFMFASQYKLDNLCVAIDVNGLQIDGKTKDVMNSEPLDKKLEDFGFFVIRIPGNNFNAIEAAFKDFKNNHGAPTAIVLDTIKGKGISFMENNSEWHGKAPNETEYKMAMEEISRERNRIMEEYGDV